MQVNPCVCDTTAAAKELCAWKLCGFCGIVDFRRPFNNGLTCVYVGLEAWQLWVWPGPA
jgi:hypothetical protein